MSLDLATRTLDDLAALANTEHRLGHEAALTAVRHAMNAGAALNSAQSRIKGNRAKWVEWCEEHLTFSARTAYRYQRLDAHREVIEEWLSAGGSGSLMGAYKELEGFAPRGLSGGPRVSVDAQRAVSDLAGLGVPPEEIAADVGVSLVSVRKIIDPEFRRQEAAKSRLRYQRERAARRALKEKERAKAVRAAGGPRGAAYEHIRKAATFLDDALSGSLDADEREALAAALQAVHRAEDHTVRSLKMGRRS